MRSAGHFASKEASWVRLLPRGLFFDAKRLVDPARVVLRDLRLHVLHRAFLLPWLPNKKFPTPLPSLYFSAKRSPRPGAFSARKPPSKA